MQSRSSSLRRGLIAATVRALAACTTGCISISWTTEEEARQQQELLRRITSDEEVLWDPTQVLKNLEATRKSLESMPVARHARILAKPQKSSQETGDLARLLEGSLQFVRAVAKNKLVVETFSRSYTSGKEIVASTATTEQLLLELDRITISLQDDKDPKAFAFYDRSGTLAPRVVLSTGLMRDLSKLGAAVERQIADIRSLENDILALPNEGRFKRVRNAARFGSRQMDIAVAGLAAQGQGYEYVFSVLFVVAHEVAHALFDRFNPPQHSPQWTEPRADLFGIVVAELLTQQAQSTERANEDVLRGGFRTNDIDKILLLTSDAGFDVFLKTYATSRFSEGDATHLPIAERRALLEPVYRELFAPSTK